MTLQNKFTIIMFLASDTKKKSLLWFIFSYCVSNSCIIPACKGKLYFTSCQSQAFEAENELNVQRIKEKELESEEDDYSSTDGQLSDNEHEISEITRSDTKQR